MTSYPDDPSEGIVRLRERLDALFQEGRHDEAADLALLMDDQARQFAPLEEVADHLAHRPEDADQLYAAALRAAEWYASCATSGAEGMGRMVEVRRLRDKLARRSTGGRLASR
jgi:hypothetical protein